METDHLRKKSDGTRANEEGVSRLFLHHEFSAKELSHICKTHNINSKGTKGKLILRIVENLDDGQIQNLRKKSISPEKTNGTLHIQLDHTFYIKQLIEICIEHCISTKGSKVVLIRRIIEQLGEEKIQKLLSEHVSTANPQENINKPVCKQHREFPAKKLDQICNAHIGQPKGNKVEQFSSDQQVQNIVIVIPNQSPSKMGGGEINPAHPIAGNVSQVWLDYFINGPPTLDEPGYVYAFKATYNYVKTWIKVGRSKGSLEHAKQRVRQQQLHWKSIGKQKFWSSPLQKFTEGLIHRHLNDKGIEEKAGIQCHHVNCSTDHHEWFGWKIRGGNEEQLWRIIEESILWNIKIVNYYEQNKCAFLARNELLSIFQPHIFTKLPISEV